VDHSGHRLAQYLGPGRALAVAAAAAGAMMLAAWFAAAWFPGVGIPAMACLAVAVGFLVILLHLPAPS
jgi:hypothetical protein